MADLTAIFNVVAGVGSVLGLLFSVLAFVQAKKASVAAREARDAAYFRSLIDDLELICVKSEQVVDFLVHGRFDEPVLRIGELTSALSEMPRRRGFYHQADDVNSLLTSREQLRSVADEIQRRKGVPADGPGKSQMVAVARRVVMVLREVVGALKSRLESGAVR